MDKIKIREFNKSIKDITGIEYLIISSEEKQNIREKQFVREALKILNVNSKYLKKNKNITERADIYVNIYGSKTDIEITEYFSDIENINPLKRIESEKNKLFTKINNKRKSIPALRNINAFLRFKVKDVPVRRNQDLFIQELFNAVQLNVNSNGFIVSNDQSLLGKYVQSIDLLQNNSMNWNWNKEASSTGYSETDMIKFLKAKKQNKKYKKPYGLWLMVVISQTEGLSSYIDEDDLLEELINSKNLNNLLTNSLYERVLLLHKYGKIVFSFDKSCWREYKGTKE